MEHSQPVVSQKPAGPQKFPAGMVVVIAYLGVTLISTFPTLGRSSGLPIGPYLFPKVVSIGYSVAGVVALAAAIYGILKRKAWGKHVAISWLAVTMVVMGLETALSLLNPQATLALNRQLTQEYLAKHHARLRGFPSMRASGRTEAEKAGLIAVLAGGLVFTWGVNGIAIVYLVRQKTFFRS